MYNTESADSSDMQKKNRRFNKFRDKTCGLGFLTVCSLCIMWILLLLLLPLSDVKKIQIAFKTQWNQTGYKYFDLY